MLKTKLTVLMVFAVLFLLLMNVACGRFDSVTDSVGTWSFSGVVVDGSTERPLSGVAVAYVDGDGTQQRVFSDENGNFIIEGIPYGERTFIFSSDTSYTIKRMPVSSYAESSSLGGVIGDVSRIVKLYPLAGSLSGTLVYVPKGTNYHLPAREVTVQVNYSRDSLSSNSEPSSFIEKTDSAGRFTLSGLPVAPEAVISFENYKVGDITYTLAPRSLSILNSENTVQLETMFYKPLDTAGWSSRILASNVLSIDGFGLTNVSVDDTIWYKLPVIPVDGTVDVTLVGGGSPRAEVRLSEDTVFINPVSHFAFDSLVTVNISALTVDGERFTIELDGVAQFRTEKSAFPVAASFWSQPWVPSDRFQIGDTLWVRFSETLDSTTVIWSQSSAAVTLYGMGTATNSNFEIKGDTLFVVPDQRLSYSYNSTMGFRVGMKTSTGKRVDFYDFVAYTIEDPLYISWTNTKDGMGRDRTDMGLRDTIKVVSSISDFTVVGASIGDGGMLPPGLMLSDISVSGDTVIYVPSLSMRTDTTYSLDFDLQFPDGSVRNDVLGVKWTTRRKVSIVDTDLKVHGMYRPLAAYGDSFTVVFSEPVDTGSNAAVIFRVTMRDVLNVSKRTKVRWSEDCRAVTVFPLDTLPTADFDAPAAYTATASRTRAVESVTFDLVTRSGEQVFGLKPDGDPIALHTEKGMCVVKTNLLPDHDGRLSVEKEYNPTSDFPLNSAVEFEFSRVIDTSEVRMDSLSMHAGIHKSGAVVVPATVTILSDQKTIRITPEEHLEPKTNYYVWVKDIPAVSISGAAAISKHGGTYSGRSASSYVFDHPFRVTQ